MPEKKEHADLRKIIKKWVKSNLDSYCLTIIDDDPRNPLGSSVPAIRGSIPDLFGHSYKHGIQVIGEAKTSNDIIPYLNNKWPLISPIISKYIQAINTGSVPIIPLME